MHSFFIDFGAACVSNVVYTVVELDEIWPFLLKKSRTKNIFLDRHFYHSKYAFQSEIWCVCNKNDLNERLEIVFIVWLANVS